MVARIVLSVLAIIGFIAHGVYSCSNVKNGIDGVKLTTNTVARCYRTTGSPARTCRSKACLSGEQQRPSTNFTSLANCEGYLSYVQCYSLSTSSVQCISDYNCLNEDHRILATIDETKSNCGGSYASSWIRCTNAAGYQCRPTEVGCQDGEDALPSTTFAQKAECDAFTDPNAKYVRCLASGSSTPVCSLNQCSSGYRHLDEFIPEFIGYDCKNNLFIGKICYSNSANSYATTVALDSSAGGMTCPAGSVLLDIVVSGPSIQSIGEIAAATYSYGTQPIKHSRCQSTSGNAFCRPDFNEGVSGVQCPTGEPSLAATSRESWNTLGECLEERYWAQPCYRPSSDGNYSFTGALDTTAGCDPDTELPLTGSLAARSIVAPRDVVLPNFYPGATVQEAIQEAAADAPNFYPLQINHYRCKTNNGSRWIAACRPEGYANTCPEGEVLLSATPFDTLALCEASRFRSKPCYRGTITEPYYEITPGFDSEGGCVDGSYDLGAGYVTTASSNIVYSESEILTLYRSANIPHYRCDAGQAPVCRPDMFAAAGPQCSSVDNGGATGALLHQPLITYANVISCELELYWGKSCYSANQVTSPFYTVTTVFDHVSKTGCAVDPNVIDITISENGWNKGSQNAVENATESAWYEAEGTIDHVRCRVGDLGVACRPLYPGNDNCPVAETPLTIGTVFEGLSACSVNLVGAKPCYHATDTYPFYTISVGLDIRTTNDGCPAGDVDLGYSFVTGNTNTPTYPSSVYTTKTIVHYRCGVVPSGETTPVPVCRPDMVPGGSGNCYVSENFLSGNNDGSGFPSLDDCMDNLYFAKPCYTPLQSGDYYDFATGYDHLMGCADGDVSLSSVYGNSSSEMNITYTWGEGATFYNDATSLPHYRCKVGTTPVCRPLAGCDTTGGSQDDGTLNNPTVPYGSLGDCENDIHWTKPCYRAVDTGVFHDFFPKADYDNESSCVSGNEIDPGLGYFSDASRTAADNKAIAAGQIWFDAGSFETLRCRIIPDGESTAFPVCRPLMGTPDDCAAIDSSALPSGVYANRLACVAQRYHFHACYRPTANERWPVGSGKRYEIEPGYDTSTSSAVWCAPGELRIGTTVYTDNNLIHDFTAADIIVETWPHRRCKRTSVFATCRPDMTNAVSNSNRCAQNLLSETPLDTIVNGTNYWNSLAGCNAVRIVAKPCYHPTTTDQGSSQYFTIVPLVDTSSSNTCSAGDMLIGSTYKGSGIWPVFDFSAEINAMKALTHYRCKSGTTPVCRPSLETAQGQTAGQFCAQVAGNTETRLTTSVDGVNSWTGGLAACNAVRYVARACYSPSNETQSAFDNYYYTLTPVYDSDATTTCSTTGQVDVNGFMLSSNQPVTVFTPAISYLQTTTTHYRCKNPDETTQAICRPDLSGAVGTPASNSAGKCAYNLNPRETQLTPAYSATGYLACEEATFTIACYNYGSTANYVAQDEFTSTSGSMPDTTYTPSSTTFRCAKDVGCYGATEAPLETNPSTFDDPSACASYVATFETAAPARNWRRCHVGSGTVKGIVCRPINYNSGNCAPGETAINDLDSDISTINNNFTNIAYCLTAPDRRPGINNDGYTKCCCAPNIGVSRKTCGYPNGANNATASAVLTGCKCLTSQCGADFYPIRLGEFFVAYGGNDGERNGRSC